MNPSILRCKDGTVPLEDEVRHILRTLMKRSGKSRLAIAQAMSENLGRPVTPSMLADFTRNGNRRRQVRFPCAWVKPFNWAVGNDELARSQLCEGSHRALCFGDLVLPWILERAVGQPMELRQAQRRKKR